MISVIEIVKCEVCESKDLVGVLNLGAHPLCDDLVEFGDDRICKEYPIDILFCENCKTAHQKYQVPKEDLFQFDYHYRARMTGSVLTGMKSLVQSIVDKKGSLQGLKVLDIGCNDGSLLNFFRDEGCKTVGVEPTSAASDSSHETINEFFDSAVAQRLLSETGKFDIITFTNVFAHIEDLNGLLNNVNSVLSENGMLVIENHYLGAVLKTGQFDTFYHEHPRTYSEESFRHVAAKINRNVTDIEYVSRYGGNIRVFIGKGDAAQKIESEENFKTQLMTMQDDMNQWKVVMRAKIEKLNGEHGPLIAKAFPGRAAILIKLLDLNKNHISAVYEITGSIKVGHYIPGTRIPIKPEKELFEMNEKPAVILNLGWHIAGEVRRNLTENGIHASVVDIKEMSA